MTFGLIANLKRTGASDAVFKFLEWTRGAGHRLILCDELTGIAGEHADFLPRGELPAQVEILVSMGGDGTLLAAARAVGNRPTPLLGINIGSLGFLTQQTPRQLISALEAIACGDYQIEDRMVLKAEVTGKPALESPFALNDVVIDNGPVSRVIDINLVVNGEDVVTYIADGLVISTPTGSTAYSLAVGGPIMKPGLNAIIAAPISPFSLTTRPMIFSGDDVLEIRVTSESAQSTMTLDGQVMVPLSDNDTIRISRAEHRTRFVTFRENSFFKLLRSKLNWGIQPKRF